MTLRPKFKRRAAEAKAQAAQRSDPGLPDFHPVMMDALWNYPEARKALRDALRAFVEKWYAAPPPSQPPTPKRKRRDTTKAR